MTLSLSRAQRPPSLLALWEFLTTTEEANGPSADADAAAAAAAPPPVATDETREKTLALRRAPAVSDQSDFALVDSGDGDGDSGGGGGSQADQPEENALTGSFAAAAAAAAGPTPAR